MAQTGSWALSRATSLCLVPVNGVLKFTLLLGIVSLHHVSCELHTRDEHDLS